ncbi:glycosyltransferase [uncultured Maribacter sp.]|uniref:glycosyltransferase n=1 Tax=uncultured Maribacter sp. TaxID=431308 RepID=UPI00261B85B4|nr:glycosyltransferase [uncultured Maribacter sp.]
MQKNKPRLKIAYISVDNFFDVDFPILPELNKSYKLIWFPIIPEKGSRYSKGEVKSFAGQNNIKYFLSVRKGRRRNIRQLFFSYKLLLRVKQVNADIIYTEYLSDIYIAFLAFFFLPRKKTIYAIHDVVGHTNFNSIVLSSLSKILRKHFKYFHIFSKSQKSIFDNSYRKKQSFYAPLALKNFGSSDKLRPSKKSCKFLFFGSILEYKGLNLLIQAAEEIISEGETNFSVTIAGKGNYWNNCKHLIKNKSHFNTKIEFIPDTEVPDLFTTHHYLVLPYLDVTQSGPQMIALNYVLPIIASNHEGFKEYTIDGETGFVLQQNTLESLKSVLRKCINISQRDYDLMVMNLVNENRTKYDISKIITQYDYMFTELLNQK